MITCLINCKVYIGQCARKKRDGSAMNPKRQLELRWREHCNDTSGCHAIHNAIAKYGRDSFTREILEEALDTDLHRLERMYIDRFRSRKYKYGYNRTLGGVGGGFTLPEVRNLQNDPSSNWMKAQKSPAVGKKKIDGMNLAKEVDPSIEQRRKERAKEATQTIEYRNETSKRQKVAQNRPETRAKRKATRMRKREELLAKLPPHEQAEKLLKLQKQAEANERFRAKKAKANLSSGTTTSAICEDDDSEVSDSGLWWKRGLGS